MDETTLNTIVGIVGGIIGVISVIITVISMRAKKVVTISTKSKIYASPGKEGRFVFDYSNNNGQYTIGSEPYLFCTKWSKASNTSIHAYKDGAGIEAIAIIKGPVDINSISSIEGDFSSRVRTPKIGDAIIWKNLNGKYAITKILNIKDDTRGDLSDELECEYVILK